MGRLRTNVLLSAVAMVVVGLMRPLFNAVITRAFGPEINGRAATISSLFFLAALPATAALPIVMVRQVSRAMSRGDTQTAQRIAAASSRAASALASFGAAAAIAYGVWRLTPPFTNVELLLCVLGALGYVYWRLARTLLLALGEARKSLIGDVVGGGLMIVCLASVVAFDRPELAVGALVATYVGYGIVTFPIFAKAHAAGPLPVAERDELLRYNLLWLIGTTTALAIREISVLLLEARVPESQVGETSLALSVLMALALAPRILELPLVHELSSLGAEAEADRQRQLTELGMHWMTLFSLGAGFTLAIIAAPLLSMLGKVSSPEVILGFAIVCLAFAAEMMVTPLTNLLVAEAPPSFFTGTGIASLALAFAWWWSPWGQNTLGILIGLALSHLLRAIGIAAFARARFRLRLWSGAPKKVACALFGGACCWGAHTGQTSPYLLEAAFLVLFAILYGRELAKLGRDLLSAKRP